ncbi:MAG: hypothetical protein HY207_07380 [Nitrospirae bacterium]|nr:hypothetical protein [Nitrospirota bacterium]
MRRMPLPPIALLVSLILVTPFVHVRIPLSVETGIVKRPNHGIIRTIFAPTPRSFRVSIRPRLYPERPLRVEADFPLLAERNSIDTPDSAADSAAVRLPDPTAHDSVPSDAARIPASRLTALVDLRAPPLFPRSL